MHDDELEIPGPRYIKNPDDEQMSLSEAESPALRALASCLSPDFLEGYKLTKTQMARLERALSYSVKKGIQATGVMICQGGECILAQSCPLEIGGVPPIGMLCPIESMYMEELRVGLMQELDIDETSIAGLARLNDLLSTMIIERRASAGLAQEQLLERNPVFPTTDGRIIYSRKTNPYLDIMDKCEKRKAAIYKEFLATPEARSKAKIEEGSDAAKIASRIKETVDRIQAQARDKVDDAEFATEKTNAPKPTTS